MNSLAYIIAAVFAGSLPAVVQAAGPSVAAPGPNIVYILADDLGYGEVSCFGQQRFQTPNIDRLAAEGIRLTSHYAGDTVCSPSRCALMTGRHSGHGRVRSNFGVGPAGESIRVGLTPEDQTVALLLRNAGYATACIGKWGLGEEGTEGVPWRQGFDHFYGFLNDAHAHNQYPEFLYSDADKVALVSNYSHERGEFADDLFTAEALRFLGAQRPGHPFFLYLAFTSPHAELTPPEDVLAETRRKYPALSAPGVDPSAVPFAAMVVRLDQHVGAITARLAELGLDRDTLVIFTSDNGPHREDGKDNAFFKASGPLRGIKRDLYEGGIREPFVARWPGRIQPGTTSAAPSAFWDFLPTVAELVGAAVPPHADGVSYLPSLLGRSQPGHPPFYWEFVFKGKARQAVRLDDWKAVRNGLTSPLELYDLANDLGEQHDVANAHPDLVARMKEIMQREHTDNSFFPFNPPEGKAKGSPGQAAAPFAPPDIPTPEFAARAFNVMEFGASGGGEKNDTQAINRAIETCSQAGGGDVVFPPGRYLAASIHLRSNVRFRLDPAAVITGAAGGYDAPEPNEFDRYQDFGHSHFHNALMWGENIENFSMVGGKVNGGHIVQGTPKQGQDIGDKLIAIKGGRNLHFKEITHETGGHFVYLLNDCENVTLAAITVKKSRDAVDLMGCRNVQIFGCRFTGCGDDTVGIKSDYALGRTIKTENIFVWDCYFETDCNGVQFGSETAGDFSNINVWNVTIGKAGKAALGIISADGARIDGVNYRDITIRNATNPIFMQVSKRLRTGDPNRAIGTIRNVKISNVVVTDCKESREGQVNPITLSGHPESWISNVVLENIVVTYPGGGTHEQAGVIPRYPEPAQYQPRYLGIRPASGLYARHVGGLALRNVQFIFEEKDQRPPMVIFDVDGMELDNVRSGQAEGVETLRLEKVKNLTIRNCPGLSQKRVTSAVMAKE